MRIHDHEPGEKLHKLESINARLAQHAKIAQLAMIWLSVLASAVLVLFSYHVISL